ncbi:efflux RND transporter permease subunit [Blautia sp.]|jgi:predicted RND superfamily exporter protein|uniref:efflux RND transporter permease subunit n=1 Tax=Blautia sp. TaxID=1955243 RepID=UPI00280B20E0|nr:MMPL family transporter [Blautia sp.]MDY3016477.1 MMPL family transporter [Blautia sp.]MED9883656.1 MMPL family transporter [Blautia sp.]
MVKLGRKIVKFRIPIFILSLLLLVPSAIGYINTRVNYDVLYYLPDDIETMKGQDILVDEFGTGAYSMFICEGMKNKDVAALKKKIENVEHVSKVVWYDSFSDLSVPVEMLPDKIRSALFSDDSTMMFIIFETTTSADETMDAIGDIRKLAGKQCFVSGMSAIVTDTKNLAESEVAIYVLIAVVLSCIVLALTMESYLIPFLFLASIGIAILYNMGTNIFKGEISYITKALSAVLQLGVTMDYSIFLWHSYQEQRKLYEDDHKEAMAQAIAATIKSVVGSSITTIAGFVALCFMSFTLGLDLGIVMAKGVIFGVICCVTVLPAMIMIFDKALEKTKHKQLIPDFPKVSEFLVKHHKAFAFICVALFIPFAYFQANTAVYYNLDSSLPKDLESIMANEKLQEEYHMGAAHMILMDKNVSSKEKHKMIKEMEQVDGVKEVLGLESIIGPSLPESMIPQDIKDILESDNYELMLITNEYQTASEEVNAQIDKLNTILKSYDKNGMLVGEAPCTKDLIEITDHDFKVVSAVSILAVFLIILFVFKSITLPVILVLVIEGAIFINMGIPYLTGTELPFIASIVIGTIQLGATVDYAILMTSRYEQERGSGKSKKESISIALESSIRPVMVSAFSFFAATFGVGIYSKIDMISSLCLLMARGALISMCAVLLFLPAMYWIFDRVICATSKNFKVRK